MIGPVVWTRPLAMLLFVPVLMRVPALRQESKDAVAARAQGTTAPTADLAKAFAAQGIHLDVEHGLCAIRATVDIREDLLEYLLVNPRGAAHESTFVTGVLPSQLNVA